MDHVEASHIVGKPNEVHEEVEASTKHGTTEREKTPAKEFQVSSDRLIPVDQLKEFIMGTIKDRFDGSFKSSLAYTKPYTPHIDGLKMPMG